ncbi:MAG: SdrD B-like domain-containing protein [Candidatus Levyibacteriota bacterium]
MKQYLSTQFLKTLSLCVFLFFYLVAGSFISKTAYAATPSIDATSNGPIGNRTISWQHTVGNNPNGMLLVIVDNNGQTISSVTYNGIALSKVLSGANGTAGVGTYALLNPSSGTHTIVVNGSSTLMGGAISLYNVNQTDPWDHTSFVNNGCQIGSTNAPFCFPAVSPARNTELWFQWTSMNDTDTLQFTPMAIATKMWVLHTGSKYFISEYLPGANGTLTPSWNISPNANNYSDADIVDSGVQAAPTSIPTPTPVTYTINGSVFTDSNKNGLKETGEANYAGTPTITASRGTVTTHSDGTYTISNLTAGSVTVSYTSLPAGYSLTYPLNGPPPSYQVTVGSGCTTNGANGASCQ